MTMQNVGLQVFPRQMLSENAISASLTGVTVAFDSTTDKLAWVGHAYHTDSISKIYLRTRTITLGDTIEVRIESVTNGRPSGSLWTANGTGANPKGTVAIADADDNVWKTVTLTDVANIVPGDLFAIVIVWSAESGGAGINIQFGVNPLGVALHQGILPCILQDTGGGTWAQPTSYNSFQMVLELTTAGVVSMPGLSPLDASGTITAYNNTSNPNEYAAKIVAPIKMRVIGMSAALFNLAAGADFSFYIWDSTDNPGAGPTPLASTSSMDGDFPYSTTTDGVINMFFASPVTLTAGTTYYAGVKADTANNISIGYLSAAGTGAATNAIRAFGMGTNTFHLSTRQWVGTDPGAWTNTTTTYPMISLIIDQLDDGAGGSGGPIGNNMRGGFCNG